ncbi:MAG: hypothetical protein J6T89_02760, partial [Bacteroidales bacterium]|nr:hypothetical protein [Bacteroidales bacterium]
FRTDLYRLVPSRQGRCFPGGNAALAALNNSLSDPIPTDTYYWSVEEHSGNFAGSYARVNDFWDNMSDRKSKSFRARAFLYL